MGCAQSTKPQKYTVKQSNKNTSSHQQRVGNITQEFVRKAKDQGISVEKIAQNDPCSSDLPTRDCRPKISSHPTLLQNIEILHKHMYPKLKPLSCNNLFKNRQNLGLSVRDQRSTIASLQPHRCTAYFTDLPTEVAQDPIQ